MTEENLDALRQQALKYKGWSSVAHEDILWLLDTVKRYRAMTEEKLGGEVLCPECRVVLGWLP
jgi:hypothetical protein